MISQQPLQPQGALCPVACSPRSPSPRVTPTRSLTRSATPFSTPCCGRTRQSRVAVETLITTGQVHVAGEVTTKAYAPIPQLVRDKILEIGYDSSKKGFDGASCGVSVSIGAQSPDIAQGVDTRVREPGRGRRGRARPAGRRRPGPDVRLRLRRDARADAAADHAGAPAVAAGCPRSARTGPSPTCAPTARPRSPSSTTATRPVRLDTVVVSSQHAVRHRPRLAARARHPRVRRRAGAEGAPGRGHQAGHRGLPAAGQPDRPLRDRRPDGRRRPDRPQDHRRHLRRHGPPRRRRVLRQGPVQGRPLGRLRDALGRQERRRRRPGRPLRGPGRLRDRQGRAGRPVRRDLRHRRRSTPRRSSRPSPRSSTCARPRSSATSTCCARSTPRPPRTATSAASCPTSPGSAPTASTRCARRPGPDPGVAPD